MWKYRQKPGVLFALLFLLIVVDSRAQGYLNRHPFDLKFFNLGFLMGFNYNSYDLKEQVNITENGLTVTNVELESRPGLNFGLISNFNVAKNHSIRIVPTFSLEDRNFTFFYDDGSSDERKVEASYLNVPVVWQYKTAYYQATRLYTLLGGQWGVNLASNKKVRDDPTLLKIDRQDFALVFGFGLNLYGDRLKLSPEIVYKMGLFNIYIPEDTRHAAAISSLRSQVLAININFE
jgi:hypothetical protein